VDTNHARLFFNYQVRSSDISRKGHFQDTRNALSQCSARIGSAESEWRFLGAVIQVWWSLVSLYWQPASSDLRVIHRIQSAKLFFVLVLQPENLLFTSDGHLKLGDFGSAIVMDEGVYLTASGACMISFQIARD
jgi:serine/threonine protein kinase